MQHLFTPEGEAALAAVMRRRLVLGFDFDGTLAPIVAHPGDARVPPAVAGRLRALAAVCPVVVVSGRAVADLRDRLGFTPRHVIGSHGADDPSSAETAAATAAHTAALQPLRAHLQRHAADLAAGGVMLEDKGASIALHYRLAPSPALARALLQRLLEPEPAGVRIFAGKRVLNAIAAAAPDKAHAMHELVHRLDADCAFFAGDDVNDEPVFASAPDDWLTVLVGGGRGHSHARFFIDGPQQMGHLLERALDHLQRAGTADAANSAP
ncbi:MAG: trehalose-phosphatase [Burkholderiales bacterium]|nr:trehalose-phosphatase [Burkholderiales bacterium]